MFMAAPADPQQVQRAHQQHGARQLREREHQRRHARGANGNMDGPTTDNAQHGADGAAAPAGQAAGHHIGHVHAGEQDDGQHGQKVEPEIGCHGANPFVRK
jgi:hypothetical protein